MVSRLHVLAVLMGLLAAAAPPEVPAQESPGPASPAPQSPAVPDSTAGDLAVDQSAEARIAELNRLILLNPRNPELYNNLGIIYAEEKNWSLARDAFIAAVQADPRLAQTHRNLGMVLVEMEETDTAVSEFETYQRLSADGGRDAYLLIGDARRRAGDAPAALQAYEDGLRVYGGVYGPGTAELVMGKALVLEESGDEAAYEAWLRLFAGPARDYLAKAGDEAGGQAALASQAIVTRLLKIIVDNAGLMSDAGLHAQAAAAYEEAMALAPDNDELLPLAATAWFEAGETMKAKVLARRATLETPDRPGGWKASGRIAEAENRPRDAIAAYRKAWDLDPAQSDVAARIGSLYLSLGDNENARKFMGAVASDPDTPPEILYNYALILQREGKHELAIHPLRKVVARAPEMASGWRALATSLRNTERFDEAARAYGEAFRLDANAKLAFQQGYCLQRSGHPHEAAEAYERALALDPADTKARYNLGLSLIAAGEYEEALAAFEALRELEPNTYRVSFNIGVCRQNLGRNEEALDAYETALEIEETAAVWNNMGLVYDAMGEKREAKQCYEEGKRLKAEGK